jgi:hypothetical protein
MQLELRERGFVYRTRRAHIPVLWDDVSEVFLTTRAIRQLAFARCIILTTNGRRVALTNHFHGIAQISARVEEETARRLLPLALLRIEGGDTAVFGPFHVTRTSLAYETRRLDWKNVGDVVIARSLFVVGDATQGIRFLPKKDGVVAWAKPRSSEIPNVAVLTALIKHFRGASRG